MEERYRAIIPASSHSKSSPLTLETNVYSRTIKGERNFGSGFFCVWVFGFAVWQMTNISHLDVIPALSYVELHVPRSFLNPERLISAQFRLAGPTADLNTTRRVYVEKIVKYPLSYLDLPHPL